FGFKVTVPVPLIVKLPVVKPMTPPMVVAPDPLMVRFLAVAAMVLLIVRVVAALFVMVVLPPRLTVPVLMVVAPVPVEALTSVAGAANVMPPVMLMPPEPEPPSVKVLLVAPFMLMRLVTDARLDELLMRLTAEVALLAEMPAIVVAPAPALTV